MKSRSLLLGLDIGSTLVKAAVFNARGAVLRSGGRRVRVRSPQPGWLERGVEDTWRAAVAVLRDLGPLEKVAAVGITGCGNGAVFLDARGKPVRAGILSSDRRATAYLAGRPHPDSRPYAGQLGSLLRWLRAEEKPIARKLAHALFWKDYVRMRLTGEAATDPTDAGAAGLLRPGGRTWLGSPDPALPPLRESLSMAGTITRAAASVTGVGAGTPVFIGCIDCEAAAIGSGTQRVGDVSMIAGTWSVNQRFATVRPRGSGLFLVNPSVLSGRWLLVEASPNSAANFDWAVRTLLGRDHFAQAFRLAGQAIADGLLFIPGVSGGEGAFVGLDARHDRGALLRAVMEGVAFGHRRHLEKLSGNAMPVRRVRLAGGAARSPLWCQIFSDVLGVVIERPHCAEVGALGAALCAGVGAGFWPSLQEAQRAAVSVAAVYEPHPASVKAMRDAYGRFVRFLECDAESLPSRAGLRKFPDAHDDF